MGFTTSLLPAIMAPDSPIRVNLEQASWLTACIGIACAFGFVYSALLTDRFGRRIAFILDSIPEIIGLLLTYYASSYAELMIGRILCGISVGGCSMLGAVVIGEFSSPKYKEMFLNLKTTALYAGSAIAHVLGYYLDWRTISIVCLLPNLISLAIVCTWPESPAWLASKKKFNRCAKNFIWLRGEDEEAGHELDELIKAQKMKKIDSGFRSKVTEFVMKFTKRDFLKPMVIFVFAIILMETSGRHIFPAYATQIVNELTGDDTYSLYYTLCLDLIITVSATFSSALVKIMKIRTVLFTTGTASVVILLSVCLYIFLVSNGSIVNRSWISVGLFGFFFILVNLGCAPIPLTLFGTLFPLAHRGVGTTLAGFMVSICMAVSMKVFPISMQAIKIYGTFTLLAIAMAVTLLVLYFILPETKDRSLQEIEYYFQEGSFRENKNNSQNSEVNEKIIV